MRARIVKRDEKIVVLKTEKEKFLKVPKKIIDFDFKVGDWVTIEKNEDEIYILPRDASDFWEDSGIEEEQKADNFAISSLLFNSLGILVSLLTLYNVYVGLIWTIFAAFGLILAAFSKTKKSKIYKASRITLWVSLVLYLILLTLILCDVIGPIMNGSFFDIFKK